MSTYKTHHFESAKSFWDQLRPEEILKLLGPISHPIYRGQGDSNWRLTPNSTRNFKNKSLLLHTQEEIILILKFIEYCNNIGIQVPSLTPALHQKLLNLLSFTKFEEQSKWPSPEFYEILAFAQHYGVSTRLLDWSSRSFVAVYFSASEAIKIMANEISNRIEPNLKRNLSVWLLETGIINSFNNSGFVKEDCQNPINIVRIPSGINAHVAAQQGCFTIFRDIGLQLTMDNINSIAIYDSSRTIDTSDMYFKEGLHKFTVPYSEAVKLMKLCEQYNVSAASLYPTATGAGFAVKDYQNSKIVEDYLESVQSVAVE